jgi:hypothetical protein
MGTGTMISAAAAAAAAADGTPEYKPFSSAVEKPLASLVSSLHLFTEDRRPAAYISKTAYASSLMTAVLVFLLIVVFLYVIMDDYRRHAVMYAFSVT